MMDRSNTGVTANNPRRTSFAGMRRASLATIKQTSVHFQQSVLKIKNSFWRLRNVRFHLGLLLCMNYVALAFMRNGLGMAMVCMVNNTAILANKNGGAMLMTNLTANTSTEEYCPRSSDDADAYAGEFEWDNSQQGMLFAAIYWGGITSIAAGWLADRYSPRHLLLYSVLINVLCSFLTPVAAEYGGFVVMFVVRVVMGAGQGIQQPAVSAFTARWIPTGERSTVISMYTAGNQLASVIGSPLNALICAQRQILGGWPLIFIASGVLGAVWALLWLCCVRNCPEHHGRISSIEREFIKQNLKSENLEGRKEAAKNVPWKSLLLSMPVLACVVCGFVDGLYSSLTGSYIPTYFMEVLKLDLNDNGLYGALPFVAQIVLKMPLAILADKMSRSGKVNPNLLSKFFNSIASFGTGAFILACGFVDCTQVALGITYLTLSMALFGTYIPGYWTSMVRIAPVYSGTIASLVTIATQLGSILAPYIVAMINKNGTKEEWRLVFIIQAVALFACGFFYLIFSSADIQPWAKVEASGGTGNNKTAARTGELWSTSSAAPHQVAPQPMAQPATFAPLPEEDTRDSANLENGETNSRSAL